MELKSLFLFRIFLAIIAICCLSEAVQCQIKVVLKTKISVDVKTVRGGESLKYIIAVENKGAATATDVRFLHNLDDMTRFVSARPKQGSCEGECPESNNFPHELRCTLGNIRGHEIVLVEVEVRIVEWGDASSDENYYAGASRGIAPPPPPPPPPSKNESPQAQAKEQPEARQQSAAKVKPPLNLSLFSPHLGCDNCESQDVATIKAVSVDLEPSRNAPPSVKITSPMPDVDLELRIQPATETARGGEEFAYTVSVTNRGPGTATDVRLRQTSREDILSGESTAGTCKLYKESGMIPTPFTCQLGNLRKSETVVVKFKMRISDFGGEEETGSLNAAVFVDDTEVLGVKNIFGSSLGDLYVSSEEGEVDVDNNYGEIRATLLPSLNLPPRVKILSPIGSRVIKRRVNGKNTVAVKIQASDPDGRVVKVRVSDHGFSPLKHLFEENGIRKIRVKGKAYTLEEFDNNPELSEYFERTATKIAKNTYTYTLNNLPFGPNWIYVDAVDDGGRNGSQSVYFDVEGDASIRISSPSVSQVFRPGSTIVIETTSTINDPALTQLRISGTQVGFEYVDTNSIPLLQKISRTGNTFRHRYVWEDVSEGVYGLKVMLFNGRQPTNFAGQRLIVAEPRIIKVVSLADGQEFKEGDPIKISVDITDAKGNMVPDGLQLIVDGRYRRTVYTARRSDPTPPYRQHIDMEYFDVLSDLGKGTHTVQIIATPDSFDRDGPILGKSEILTITVK